MSDYIISKAGLPKLIKATAFRGLLWNEETHLPYIDAEAFERLSPDQRSHINHLFSQTPKMGPAELIKHVKRITMPRNARVPKTWPGVKSRMKSQFFHVNDIGRDDIVRGCALMPSSMPITYKLAMAEYAFGPQEIFELKLQPRALFEMGRYQLLAELSQAGLVNLEKEGLELPPLTGPDAVLDPIEVTKQWYGLASGATLAHMADFFGGARPFFDFIRQRAQWIWCPVKKVIQDVSSLGVPENTVEDAALWKSFFEKQMRSPHDPETDLLQIYPKLDHVGDFLKRSEIVPRLARADYIVSVSKTCYYANAAQDVVLAKLCSAMHYSEIVFEDALRTMAAASPEDLIPDVTIDGSEFGCPDFELVKLSKHDPMILLAGGYANGCGHIGQTGKKLPMVRAMVTHPDVGCYVVRGKADKRPGAKLTAWLSPVKTNGGYDLVLNAWHSSDMALKQNRATILRLLGQAVKKTDPAIEDVFIGKHGFRLPFPLLEPDMVEGAWPMPRDPRIVTKDTSQLYRICHAAEVN